MVSDLRGFQGIVVLPDMDKLHCCPLYVPIPRNQVTNTSLETVFADPLKVERKAVDAVLSFAV